MIEFIKRLLCMANVIHDYRIEKRLSDSAVKCNCRTCGKEIAYNHDLGLCVDWDESVDNFYKELNKAKNKKNKKTETESDYARMKRDYV